jgi:hypothetical protein
LKNGGYADLMNEEAISEVGIDAQGSLYLRPSSTSFEHIYRAGKEVHWDPERKVLLSPKPRDWSYTRWFERIVAAAAEEYGVRLSVTPSTLWLNVPSDLKAAISKAS